MSSAFQLSDRALNKALELQSQNPNYHKLPLRLYIEGKGCDGFYYGVTFDNPEEGDFEFTIGDLSCTIDERTLLFCKGSLIDWIEDERGTGFLVENPKEKNFRGKFYKKSTWRTRLEALANKDQTSAL